MTTEEVIEKLDDMYHSDSPFMYGRREPIKEAIKMLGELEQYKKGVSCLIPLDVYEKQCVELSELRKRVKSEEM